MARFAAPAILFAALALFSATHACAGAWTLPNGSAQIIAGVTYSGASRAFDRHGAATMPIHYEKTLLQAYGEYGWNDWLTLVLVPEYAIARLSGDGRKMQSANDGAVSGGMRVRLLNGPGVLSAQLTATTAGAFDMSVSADGAPGRQLELRMLYGSNFTFLTEPGFFDVEVGQRWIAGARADEVPVDMTIGLRASKRVRVLLQSFNVVTEGRARPPYSYFRLHKISMSAVTRLWPGLYLETGGYFSPTGRNALDEKGIVLRFWFQI